MSVTIYHNPRCSKSRQALAILQEKNIEIEIIEYLKTPPNQATLKKLLSRLGIPARRLLRKGEPIYKESMLDNTELPETDIIKAMVKHPILIERPIVISNDKAVIGRPPENVLRVL